MGDLLAVLAAFVWACYSILTRKISSFGYPVILTTRRTFFYGILFMVPALFLFDFEVGLERFADMTYLLNILYLGLGASALCFVTWNLAVKVLGANHSHLKWGLIEPFPQFVVVFCIKQICKFHNIFPLIS